MILDTNALSAFLAGEPRLRSVLRTASGLCLPTIVIGEYRYGLLFCRLRDELETALSNLIAESAVFAVDVATTHLYAQVRSELKAAGTPIPENDVWIAAITRQHGLPLLSQDGHFDEVKGLSRVSW
jgi:predicted nucleic acid-binding protein